MQAAARAGRHQAQVVANLGELDGPASDCRETDIAVLTPYKISADEEARLSSAVAEFNSKNKESVSVIDIDHQTFSKWKDSTPLYQEIDRTGILLWSGDIDTQRK